MIRIPESLFVGVDLSGSENVAQFLVGTGEFARRALSFDHTLDGYHQLISAIEALHERQAFGSIRIGMEATGLYWWHLAEHCRDVARQAELPICVYVLNPSLIKGLKKALGTALPKTDYVDAYVIAERLKLGNIRPLSDADLRHAPLARLTRFRMTLVDNVASEKNRACQLLFLKCPEYTKVAGGRTFSKGSMALIDEFTAQELADKPMEELLQVLLANSNNRLADPEAFVQNLRTAARNSSRLSSKMEDSVSVTLSMTLANIRFFEQQIKRADAVIAQELKAIPQTLDTILGIGPVLAAGIISEIGDISRFSEETSLARYAGLTWTVNQSGSFRGQDTSLTKVGNHYLRYYLVEAANSLRVHNQEYKAFYDRKYAEVPKHQHKRALVLTARKFVRLVHALLSTGQIYRKGR